MSRGRTEAGISRFDARVLLLVASTAVAVLVVFVAPARSATQNIDVGNFYFGSQATTTINATVGDQLRFSVITGTSHSVDISGLGVASGPFNKDDPPFVVSLDQVGTFTIECAFHEFHSSGGHPVQLVVSPPPTTTAPPTTSTTAPPTTTTTTEPPGGSTTTTTTTSTTTTTPPGGSTTTTTTTPGATTTSTTAAPGGVTTTLPADVSTTLAGGTPATTTTTRADGPAVPGATGDGPEGGEQALGITSPSIDDAGWVRPLWWTVLGASIVGLVWVAFAWRRRPTEYD